MEDLFRLFMGPIVIAIGCWAFLGLFGIQTRMQWKGTLVEAGSCSHLGFALTFICGGILVLVQKNGERVNPLLAAILLSGSVLTIIGYLKDFRRTSR